jgi:ribosomal protein S27AE
MTDQREPGAPTPGDDQGGDPVCWLNRVCPECGRFAADAEGGGWGRHCAECGAELPS